MLIYLPCKLGENFIERKFVTWENGKRIYKDGENFGLYGFDKGLFSSSIIAIPLSSYQKFFSYDESGRFSQEYVPKYKISVDLDTVYKLSDIGFPSGKKAHLYGLFKKDNSLYAKFVTTDRYEHLRYRIKDTIQYAGLDEEPVQTQIIYEPEEREDLEMARRFDNIGENSSLKNIVNKMTSIDTVTMKISDLVHNPDNEYLFGYEGLERVEESIKEIGFKGYVQAWRLPDGKAELCDGHKRSIAASNCGMDTLLVKLYDMPKTEVEKRVALLYFNLGVRNAVVNSNPIYTARQIAYHRETLKMMNFKGEKRAELSRVFGISAGMISKYEAILRLDEDLQNISGNLGLDNISAIANLEPDKQKLVHDCIMKAEADGEYTTDTVKSFIKAVKENDTDSMTVDTVFEAMNAPQEEDKAVLPDSDEIEGQMELTSDFPEYAPDNSSEESTASDEETPRSESPAITIEENTDDDVSDETTVPVTSENLDFLKEKIANTNNYQELKKACDVLSSTITRIDDYGDNVKAAIDKLTALIGTVDNEIKRLSAELEEQE